MSDRLQTFARYELPDDDACEAYAEHLLTHYGTEDLIDEADLWDLVDENYSNIEAIADQALNKLCAIWLDRQSEDAK